MKRFKQMVLGFVVTGFAMAGLVAASAAPASAQTVHFVGGGQWIFGVSGNSSSSQYYHPSGWHRSSVENWMYGLSRSWDQPGGIWTYASEQAAPWGNNAYWNVY